LAVLLLASLACGQPPSPTPQPTTELSQAIAAPPTNTALPLPTFNIPLPTDTPLSNDDLSSNDSPIPTATQLIFPTPMLMVEACSCSGVDLNCDDFGSHASAQACFDYCKSLGLGDVFGLDRDTNGLACESLP
jgi:hypothetical protein